MTFFLVVIRVTLLSLITWNIHVDYSIKKRIALEKLTVWGEISTFLTFFLLTTCSIIKMKKLAAPDFLFKLTAFVFQWTLLVEITLTVVVWAVNLLIDTDLEHMSTEQLEAKLYFDIVVDLDNYNHWLPLVLLLIEWHINNIPFSW